MQQVAQRDPSLEPKRLRAVVSDFMKDLNETVSGDPELRSKADGLITLYEAQDDVQELIAAMATEFERSLMVKLERSKYKSAREKKQAAMM